MKSFSFARVGALLKYDWMLGKRKFTYTIGIIFCIWLIAVIFAFWGNVIFNDGNSLLSTTILVQSSQLFNYFHIAMVLVITTLLTSKFISPRSSTAYLTLPGSSLEKFVTVLIDYLFGSVSIYALTLVCQIMLSTVGSLIDGDMNWWIWVSAMYDPSHFVHQIIDMKMAEQGVDQWDEINYGMEALGFGSFDEFIGQFMTPKFWILGLTSSISGILFYLNLVMCFKKNAQVKAIASYVGIVAVIVVISVFCFIGWAATYFYNLNGEIEPNMVLVFVNKFMNIFFGIMYITPIMAVAFGYMLYRQIAKKQAC